MSDIADVIARMNAQRRKSAAETRPSTVLTVLSPERALAISATPMSDTLVDALDALNGPLVRIERPDQRWPDASPIVTYAQRALPADTSSIRAEVEVRIKALQVVLAPADRRSVVQPWAVKLAAAMRCKLEGEELAAHLALLVDDLNRRGLPAFCYTPETKDEIVTALGPWLPAFADLVEPLAAPAQPFRHELCRLGKLLEVISTPQQAALTVPSGPATRTDGEVAAWIAAAEDAALAAVHGGENTQPDRLLQFRARAFRARLRIQAPALAEMYAARLDALCGHQEPSQRPIRGLDDPEHQPGLPKGVLRPPPPGLVSPQEARRLTAARIPLPHVSDKALAALAAENQAMVVACRDKATPKNYRSMLCFLGEMV